MKSHLSLHEFHQRFCSSKSISGVCSPDHILLTSHDWTPTYKSTTTRCFFQERGSDDSITEWVRSWRQYLYEKTKVGQDQTTRSFWDIFGPSHMPKSYVNMVNMLISDSCEWLMMVVTLDQVRRRSKTFHQMSWNDWSVSGRSGRAKGLNHGEKLNFLNQAISPHHLWMVYIISTIVWCWFLSRVSPNLGKKQRCEGFLFTQQKQAFHVDLCNSHKHWGICLLKNLHRTSILVFTRRRTRTPKILTPKILKTLLSYILPYH